MRCVKFCMIITIFELYNFCSLDLHYRNIFVTLSWWNFNIAVGSPAMKLNDVVVSRSHPAKYKICMVATCGHSHDHNA